MFRNSLFSILVFQSVWLFAFTAVVLSDMAWGLAGAMLFAMLTVIARTQRFVSSNLITHLHN